MTRISDRTVLFADLRGSTALFETLGNAEATSVVTHCVTALAVPVADHHGTVVKTLGDGLMAVFDDPPDALAAAVQMHDVLDAIVSRGSERGASSGLRALRRSLSRGLLAGTPSRHSQARMRVPPSAMIRAPALIPFTPW